MKSIGEKIKEIRQSKGISQTVVATACSIKQSSYANIENGSTTKITIEVGKGISKALDVSFNELFEIESSNGNAEIIEKLTSENENLKKQLDDKMLMVDLLLREQEMFKKTSVQSIVGYYDNIIFKIDEELKNAQTEEEKAYLDAKKRNQLVTKQYMIDNFIHIGFLKQIDIDDYYKELKEHYEILGKIWKENYDKGEYQYLINMETGNLTPKE